MGRRRGTGFVAAIGAASAAVLAWSAPAAAAGDSVLSTASPPRPGSRAGNGKDAMPLQRQREAARGMPAVPAVPPPQPYPSGPQMPVYVGPGGVVAVPTIDMTPNSGVVYAPPPPRSAIVEDSKR